MLLCVSSYFAHKLNSERDHNLLLSDTQQSGCGKKHHVRSLLLAAVVGLVCQSAGGVFRRRLFLKRD